MEVDEASSGSSSVESPKKQKGLILGPEDIARMAAAMEEGGPAPLPKAKQGHGFAPLTANELSGGKVERRKIPVPPNRMTPLKDKWVDIYTPLVTHLGLQVKMNLKAKCVELRTGPETVEGTSIQKGADFLKAFMLGFELADAVALLRMDDLFLESFEVEDVKMLKGDHLSRAIGRIAGQAGKTKFTIENTTKTRIVLADTKVHILGSFNNIKIARDAICDLIMGSPPGKVYNKLRTVATRMSSRF